MYDVIIIGSGIIGSFIAHNLSKYHLKVLVLEKELEVGNGVSKANSAIIHSGYDPEPGTLKAKLNVVGNEMYEKITQELNVPFKRVGSYTLAFTYEEEAELRKLYDRGIANGVDVVLLDKEELLKQEKNIKDTVRLGLYSKTTGILYPWDMIYALLENARYNGVELKLGSEVTRIEKGNFYSVYTSDGMYNAKRVINASGNNAHDISLMVVDNVPYKMTYTRGQYYVIDKGYDLVKSVIFPVPTKQGKGVLVVPTIHGNILLGPTSEIVQDGRGTDVTKEGLTLIKENVNKMMDNIPYKGIIRSFSGVRPKTDTGDFIIRELCNNFIECAGIDSPGLASAPAIANMVEEMILEKEKLILKTDYEVYPQKQISLVLKPITDINALIKTNPKYGKVICRCEGITEGEIVDAIHGLVPVTTLDGIKQRLRPGSGRCQGGFCQPLIVSILARELNVPKLAILLNDRHSNILIEETKSGGLYE